MPPNSLRFARLPEAVLCDPKLDNAAVRVYAILAMHVHQGNIVTVGQRRLAEISGMDRRTIRRSFDNLAKQGHISTAITKLGRRTIYQLNSAIFTDVQESSGGGLRPLVGVVERPRIDIEEKVVAFSRPARPAGPPRSRFRP